MKKVTNTRAEGAREPMTGLMTALPGGIEANECRGQVEFVESDVLPSQMRDYRVGDDYRPARLLLEAWGFVFGKHVGGDTLFRQAKLPTGWKKVSTDHDMWSKIVDECGRERCSVFYKAAFYDRDAFLSVCGRFHYDRDYEDETLRTNGPQRGVIRDRGADNAVLFVGPWRTPSPELPVHKVYEMVSQDMVTWIQANASGDPAVQWAQP